MTIYTADTTPYMDQQFGTSGLRKKTAVYRQQNYIENLTQSIFNVIEGFEGKTLIIGGDGRYYNNYAIQAIIKIALANQVGHIIVGQKGMISTPCASYLIVKKEAFGGIILTASHNPGGANGDFGLKYNTESGAQAGVALTNKITQETRKINHFWTMDIPDINLNEIGKTTIGTAIVEVIDAVEEYADYMQEIFNFNAIRALFKSGFTLSFNAMNAVTGPYAVRIFEELLGATSGAVINKTPQPDFGGLHPEPNLTYAKDFVDFMHQTGAPDIGAASDGDGDRCMILGPNRFVSPADSLAILAQYIDTIDFYKGRIYGVARSMPTTNALDLVAKSKNMPVYAVPTGWKYFGNLMQGKLICLCGEESFGAGSLHAQEKDGIWVVLMWLHILAITGKSVNQLVDELWAQFGRVYNSTQSYEGLTDSQKTALVDNITTLLPTLKGQQFGNLTVQNASIFNYTDPVTGEQDFNQGFIIDFEKGRIFMRFSGTGTNGATLRMYYTQQETSPELLNKDTLDILQNVIESALILLKIPEITGKTAPDIIT